MGDKDPVLSVVDGLADAALLFDRDLRLVHFNRSLVILSGLRVRALRRELSSAETPFAVFGRSKDHEVALEVLALGRPRRLDEVMITTSAGAKHITIITMIPILEEGLATGLIYVMRDVTAESDQHANYKELLRSERARAEELECRVEVRTRELTLALQEVTRLARTDPLTGALNRRAFLAHAEQAIDMARRHDRCVGLLMCDLDHFKRVNDNYGHQAGDALLVRVVESMNEMVRTTDKVGRFGGEEFALLLTETVRPAVMSIAARCNESIRKIDTSKLVAGRPWKQTISIGCAIFPDDASDFDELVGKADLALYQAKETGRDKNVRYSSQLEVDAADEKAGEVGHRVLVFGSGQGVSPEILENMEEKHQVIVANALEEAIEFVENDTFDVLLVFDNTRDSSALDFFSASLPHQLSAVRILVVQTSDRFSALRKNGVHYIDKFLLKQDFEEHAEGIVEDGLSRREVELRRLLDKRSDRTGRTSLGDRKFEKLLRMGAFQIAFQPIVDASSLRIRGYEAFCRPVSHLFRSPMDLFEVAVQQARVQELSLAIREKIAEQIADAPADTLLFVNLHPLILEDQGFLDGEGPLRPFADRIVFEITERNAIPDFRRYREHLNRIESYGFSFAVDDLGSGYASLNAVSMLRPKYLKLDRALIHGIAHSPQQRSLVSRIMDFARESDIAVVAEGIEERSEAEEVMKLGCDMLQGFYFAKPTAQFLSVNIEGHIRSVSWRGLELVLLPFFSVFGIF